MKNVSKLGGKALLEKYGREHFSDMGKRSAKARAGTQGPEYFRNLQRLGVEARRKRKEEKKGLGEKIVDKILSI